MEPILTLPYSEWLVAEHLMKALPSSDGYSVYAPLSRQEKGVDLLLTRRTNGTSRAATLQVKYSRAYEQRPRAKCKFVSWFSKLSSHGTSRFLRFSVAVPKRHGSWRRFKNVLVASVAPAVSPRGNGSTHLIASHALGRT